jgi:MFS family permease
MSAEHDAYAALRHRDYRLLLSGGVLTSIASEAQAVVVGWELYERTDSKWLLGVAGLAQFLPVLLLALPAGQAADRFSRKVLFRLAVLTAALTSLALSALSFRHGPVELIFVCLVLSGVARAFAGPARSSLLFQVVAPQSLGNAVTWNSSGWQFASVVGPALGGLLLAGAGRADVVYLASALLSLLCVFLLGPIRPRPVERPSTARSLASLLSGVRFVWRTEPLMAAITLDLFAVLLGGATALLPVFARDILHVGPAGLGWLRAAPALGAILMALFMAHRPPLRRPGRALLWAVAGFGASIIVFGLSENFLLSFLMLALSGALDNVSVVVRGTLVQTLTPDDMRGRVAAVNTVFISSSNELGAFESGATAALFGPILSVVGGGVGTIVVVLLVLWRWPALLRLGPVHALLPAEPPPAAPAETRIQRGPSDQIRVSS